MCSTRWYRCAMTCHSPTPPLFVVWQAGLEGVKKELSTLPDQQPLHLYLPDICRSRYDHPPDKELNSAIAPLLKDRKTAEARIRPFRGACAGCARLRCYWHLACPSAKSGLCSMH